VTYLGSIPNFASFSLHPRHPFVWMGDDEASEDEACVSPPGSPSPSLTYPDQSVAKDAQYNERRTILLIDMDCFYASVEMKRLNIPPTDPLVVLQWGMCLAINYPARALDIVRGVTRLEEVKMKLTRVKNGHIIHCPTVSGDTVIKSEEEERYDVFDATDAEKAAALKRDDFKYPDRSIVKSSLERYRVASETIFSAIREYFDALCGKSKYTYQRASIDEMFIDLTDFCDDSEVQLKVSSLPPPTKTNVIFNDKNDVSVLSKQYRVAAHCADGLRQKIMDELGFSISIGIAQNKMIAKLSASHAKPFGLSVLPEESIRKFCEQTKFRKARGLAGKFGAKVEDCLVNYGVPKNEGYSLADVGRVSKGVLESAMGKSSAEWLVNVSEGREFEPVEETATSSVKQFSSVCSFGAGSTRGDDPLYSNNGRAIQSFAELTQNGGKVYALVNELCHRVKSDLAKNNRYPNNFTIWYAAHNFKTKASKTVKFLEEKRLNIENLAELLFSTMKSLGKGACFPLHRISITAANFIERADNDILKAFGNMKKTEGNSNVFKSSLSTSKSIPAKKRIVELFANSGNSNSNSNSNSSSNSNSNSNSNGKRIANQHSLFFVQKKQKIEKSDLPPSTFLPHEQNKQKLLEMGFPEEKVIKALKDHDNDFSNALNQMFS